MRGEGGQPPSAGDIAGGGEGVGGRAQPVAAPHPVPGVSGAPVAAKLPPIQLPYSPLTVPPLHALFLPPRPARPAGPTFLPYTCPALFLPTAAPTPAPAPTPVQPAPAFELSLASVYAPTPVPAPALAHAPARETAAGLGVGTGGARQEGWVGTAYGDPPPAPPALPAPTNAPYGVTASARAEPFRQMPAPAPAFAPTHDSSREAPAAGVGRGEGCTQVWCPASTSSAWKTEEQLLRRNVERCRGGLVFKAHRWLYHSALVSRVLKRKKKDNEGIVLGRENTF